MGKKRKNKKFIAMKHKSANTIAMTLMLGLFIAVLAIMAVTNIISSVAVKSIQTEDKIEFYGNAFDISLKDYYIKKYSSKESRPIEIPKEFPIKDLISSNEENFLSLFKDKLHKFSHRKRAGVSLFSKKKIMRIPSHDH